jgi:hypothetical protein
MIQLTLYRRLLKALALYLAQPVKRHCSSATPDPQYLAAILARRRRPAYRR